jgi:hypothetical protein
MRFGMMTLSVITGFALMVSAGAQANTLCEMLQTSEQNSQKLFSLQVDRLDEAAISQLETITKQQIIIGFNQLLGERFRSTLEVATTGLQDPFFSISLLNGQKYIEVGHYPGDNIYSVYFEYGGLTPVASNADGSINCL